MKHFPVSGVSRGLALLSLCVAGFLPVASGADDAPRPDIATSAPAAPWPFTADEDLEFGFELGMLGQPVPAADREFEPGDFELRDEDLLFVFEDDSPVQPIETFRVTDYEPEEGLQVSLRPQLEGLTFEWRVGFR